MAVMAREQANISTGIWADRDWRKLPQSAKYLYMLLLSHPTLNYAGVADWRPAKLAMMSPDTTAASIEETADILQDARFIFVDKESEEVLIRSYLRHDGILKQPKLSISMANAFASIASSEIQDVVINELHRLKSEHDDWAAWRSEKVQVILKHPGQDMSEFTLSNARALPIEKASVCPPVTLNGDRAQALPTTTSTSTSTKEDTSEVADATLRPDVQKLLDLLDEHIQSNGAKPPTRTKKNHDAARLLIDRDGYTVEQIAWMIRWATNDEFWRQNILSMSKLREKFDQLKLQAGAGKAKQTVGFDGEINPDDVLGKDYWSVPKPPGGLDIQEEIAWKKARRAERQADRMEQAKAKLRGDHGAAV